MTRFTLRDVFWLTLVVGMGVGWWVREREWKRQAELWEDRAYTLRDDLFRRGTEISFDKDGGMTVIQGSWEAGS